MKRKSLRSIRMSLYAAACCVALTGCESYLNPPTQITQNEIRLNQAQRSIDLDAEQVGRDDIRAIVEDYKDNGVGGVVVRVTYPRGGMETTALDSVKKINNLFRKEGFSDAKVVIMPADEAVGRALVSYRVLEALPPKDCGLMPGMHGATSGSQVGKYKLGCDTRLNMSRQIARPKDLLGNAPEEGFDSQRQSIIYDGLYRSGTQMQPLGGESASGTGGD